MAVCNAFSGVKPAATNRCNSVQAEAGKDVHPRRRIRARQEWHARFVQHLYHFQLFVQELSACRKIIGTEIRFHVLAHLLPGVVLPIPGHIFRVRIFAVIRHVN